MAAKGSIAKDALVARFRAAVGNDYIGTDETGKKFYFWSQENGERVQVCISLTVPKTPLVCEGNGGDLNFEDEESGTSNAAPAAAMGADEKATLDRLMRELGL